MTSARHADGAQAHTRAHTRSHSSDYVYMVSRVVLWKQPVPGFRHENSTPAPLAQNDACALFCVLCFVFCVLCFVCVYGERRRRLHVGRGGCTYHALGSLGLDADCGVTVEAFLAREVGGLLEHIGVGHLE